VELSGPGNITVEELGVERLPLDERRHLTPG
jgi:hypothetical protein